MNNQTNLDTYQKKFLSLKKLQRPFVDKYNSARSRDKKKEHYAEIMKYEEKLEALRK